MKNRFIWAALLFAASPVFAQTPPQSVTLDRVLDLSRNASLRLQIERQGVSSAEAELTTAGAYPNPTLNYGRERPNGGNPLFEGRRQQGVGVEIPLLIAGQRGARIEAAERALDAARTRLTATGNELAAEAGVAFVDLLVAQEKRSLLQQNLSELKRIQGVISGRHASGLASRYDTLRIDAELVAWQTRLAEAQADLIDRQANLAALLGFRNWQPSAVGALQPLSINAGIDANFQSPLTLLSRKEEEAARANVKLASRERFPNLALNAGRTWTSDPYGATNTVGLSIEIPILDTRPGPLQKARAEARAAELRRELVESEVNANVARYAAQVEQKTVALKNFQEQIEGRLPSLKQMAEDAYRLKDGAIIDLLDATRTYHEIQVNKLELLGTLMASQLRLQSARGEFAAP